MPKRYDLFEMWCASGDGSTLQEWLTHFRITERNLRHAQHQQRAFAAQMLATQAQQQQHAQWMYQSQLYAVQQQRNPYQQGAAWIHDLGQIGGIFGGLGL